MPLHDTATSRKSGATTAPSYGAPVPRGSRFAVVLRLFEWDGFIARQAERFASVSDGGDFFLSVDDTHGPVRTNGSHRVFRTTNKSLLQLGLPDRFGHGSLVWWNNDYPFYAFQQKYPHYDYYVFAEYDSLVRLSIADLVGRVAACGAEFVTARLREPNGEWFWEPHSRLAYPEGPLRASLNCVVIASNRAIRHLYARRIAMGYDDMIRQWPMGEAFIPTEIFRGGFRTATLEMFGDTSAFDWFPPILEERLGELSESAFLHPVLDAKRVRASILRNTMDWRAFLHRDSAARLLLRTLPQRTGAVALIRASWRSFSAARRIDARRRALASGAEIGW